MGCFFKSALERRRTYGVDDDERSATVAMTAAAAQLPPPPLVSAAVVLGKAIIKGENIVPPAIAALSHVIALVRDFLDHGTPRF